MIAKLTLQTKDAAYMYVDSDDKGIIQEMAEYFTFFVPGYKFMPQFRNKLWDGKLRLLNLRDQSMYSGLYKHVCAFCAERNIQIEILPHDIFKSEGNLPGAHQEVDMSFIDELCITIPSKRLSVSCSKTWLRK